MGKYMKTITMNVEKIPNNKFMKILIGCGATLEQLKNYEWFIDKIDNNKYHCIGYHPVAARIDLISEFYI